MSASAKKASAASAQKNLFPPVAETPATAQNKFVMPGLISARRAAQEIVTGMEKGGFHIHFPKGFTNWLRMARLLPYRWYFSLIHKVTGL